MLIRGQQGIKPRQDAGQRIRSDCNLRRSANQRCIEATGQRNRGLRHLLIRRGTSIPSDEREKADAAGLLIVVGKSLKASHNQPIHQRDAGGITDGQPCRLLSRQQGHNHRHYTCGAEGVNQCARFDHLAAFRSQWNRPGNRTG